MKTHLKTISAAGLSWLIFSASFAATKNNASDFEDASSFDIAAVENSVHLLFGKEDPKEKNSLRFFYTKSEDGGESWEKPVEIPTDHAPPGRHQRGHDPQIALAGDQLMALWTARGEGPFGSGGIATALSSDGGKTWKKGPSPDGKSDSAGFRFPAAAGGEKAFHAVWIHAEEEERSLRYSKLSLGTGDWSPIEIVDDHICACCWNQIRIAEDGTIAVIYRDQEPSDMSLAISENNGRWKRVGSVGTFNWDFLGCPHVGSGFALNPTEAFGDSRLLATAWTGESETRGAYILTSDDRGKSWQSRLIPETDSPGNINTDLVRFSSKEAVLVWDRAGEKNSRQIFISKTEDNAESWSAPKRISEKNSKATHPRIAATTDGYLLLWTESTEGGKSALRIVKENR